MKINLDNTQIHYNIYGSGTAVLMIHGFTPDHRLMKGCLEPVFDGKRGYKRIYFDLPGMGKTRRYEQISTTDEMLEAVLFFIDEVIGDEPFIIIGESYGGYLARGVIAKRKEQIIAAAFICPLINPNERSLPPHFICERDEEFLTQLSQEDRINFEKVCVVLNEHTWNRYRDEILAGCKLADHPFLEKIRMNYAFSYDIDSKVGSFDEPTLFLLGKQDSITGYEDAFNILSQFPRATFAVLDQAGHNLQIEQEGLFHSLVEEWLKRVSNRPSV
ncbi:alpha/beta fold hydrolase [Mechercharimyces sp. CAU 1602]|uniref:alpha/beta fold hydrolase n=1 Tax=Mechercharimyces sp. CAU 1602 TaxID=2973933 RepID=UPI0021633166|nr:alpha/beta hydrolase [Mechercharimyces sp. CAU 1602]MCS1351087.1 alpha/beta hydrolase [Mechercharimyces sp. CAU 1602]